MDYPEIKKIIKKEIGALFRKYGFKGSGTEYIKLEDDLIEIIRLQFDKHGYKICINLGITFQQVLPYQQKEINRNEYLPAFDSRLSDSIGTGDYWWDINNEIDIEIALISIKEKFESFGIPYFNQYKNTQQLFLSVANEIIDLNKIPEKYFSFGFSTEVRTIFLISIYLYKKMEYDLAKQLSEIALSKIIGKKGSGLIQHLEDIINRNFA